MNILIFSWRGPGHPNSGGAEVVTHEHAKAWVKAGHSVTLFTSIFPHAQRKEYIQGVKIVRLGNQHVLVQYYAWRWFRKHAHEFDIIFDHFHGIPFYTPLYVTAKKVAFIHEVAREVWKLNALPFFIQWFPAIVGPVVEKVTFQLYKNIPFVTVSNSTKKDLMEYGIPSQNITVIPNGLTLPESLKSFPKETINTVMYLGPIAKDKGIDDALEVFAKLAQINEAFQFWIVGKGGKVEIAELQKRTRQMGIEKRITFWGYVTDNKKFELLKRAHILINPSVHEGWGLVNIEANACGTPVVAYDVHGCRDSVKNGVTGILVEKGDIDQIAKAILDLLKDRKRYLETQRKAIVWSKEFSWEKATKESLKFISSL